MERQTTIASASGWSAYAQELVRTLRGGAIIGLSGPLGAGKTTLVQEVARALGIAGRVTSPTFVLVKTYAVPGKKFKKFCHADLYRTKKGELPEALAECLGDPGTVCFVEWAEKIRNKLPKGATMLSIEITPEGRRRITKTAA